MRLGIGSRLRGRDDANAVRRVAPAASRGSVALAGLAIAAALAGGRPAAAQNTFWGWGLAGNPTTSWSSDALADYLLTGHAPHPAVARIIAPESGSTSMGSGVLVDVNQSQGLVLTNWHVVRDSRSAVLVQFPDGFQSAGTVVRWDEAWDLAAIAIWKPKATPVTIAATAPQVGERLTIAGFGRGVYREEAGPCTEYLAPGTGYAKEFVELEARARQGDSGGPIFNDKRELAGVLFGQNEGRTIGSCSTRVRTFLATVGSKGFTPTPIAEFSAERAIDRGLGTEAVPERIAATSVSDVVPRSTHVPGDAVAVVAQVGPPPGAGGPPAAWPVPAQPPVAPSPLSSLGLPAWLPDPFLHGGTMLSAAGGLALVVLGLRTLFGGRRPA
ncbi:MAG: serine protease [Pirellulales bacterium]